MAAWYATFFTSRLLPRFLLPSHSSLSCSISHDGDILPPSTSTPKLMSLLIHIVQRELTRFLIAFSLFPSLSFSLSLIPPLLRLLLPSPFFLRYSPTPPSLSLSFPLSLSSSSSSPLSPPFVLFFYDPTTSPSFISDLGGMAKDDMPPPFPDFKMISPTLRDLLPS